MFLSMADNITTKTHGGARPGAGRPRRQDKSKLYSFRASGEMARFLDAQEQKTEFIKSCIVHEMSGIGPAERHGQECASGLHALSAETKAECQTVFSSWGKAYPATMVKDVSLPFFDIGIVAGFPIPLDNDEKSESIELLQMLCPHPESSYLIRVEGSSMIDAGICSGDIVIVDKSNRSPSPNEVAVCELNGEYTLKRFEKRGGEGWLIPANPDYPEIRVGEGDSFSIWGTVTYVIHKPHSK